MLQRPHKWQVSEGQPVLPCIETLFSGLFHTGSVLGSQRGSPGSAKEGPLSRQGHLLLGLKGGDEAGSPLHGVVRTPPRGPV